MFRDFGIPILVDTEDLMAENVRKRPHSYLSFISTRQPCRMFHYYVQAGKKVQLWLL